MMYLGKQPVGAVIVADRPTTEVPRKWKRPADWPNLDLVDMTQTRVVYVTIFCDGTWSNLYLGGNTTDQTTVSEITLDENGQETFVRYLPFTYTGVRLVDISGLSRGLHLIKATVSTPHLAVNWIQGDATKAKTLETYVIYNSEIGYTGNTGGSQDYANGTSIWTEHIRVVGLTHTAACAGFPYSAGAQSVQLCELVNCSFSNARLDGLARYSSATSISYAGSKGVSTGLPLLYGCYRLESLDFNDIDLIAATGVAYFLDCRNLTHYSGLKNIKVSHSYANCVKLTRQSLLNIIDGLAEVSAATTLTLGAVNLAKLTDEEIAVATEKGWTVA